MKHFHTLVLLLIISVPFLFQNCTEQKKSSHQGEEYLSSIKSIRKKKDLEFKNQNNSPIPLVQREGFTGLKYFEIDQKWKIKAGIHQNDSIKELKMAYTDGEVESMLNLIQLTFSIHKREYRLNGFINANDPRSTDVFIPFYDNSNGVSTYTGGRYLEINLLPSMDSVWLDFNLTYNPYCYYSASYSCPIPPESNYLDVQITAGEKSNH